MNRYASAWCNMNSYPRCGSPAFYVFVVIATLALAGSALSTWAQPYPSKSIRLVVPFPPGGTSDVLARTIGQDLGERLRASVIVDNRSGAGGMVGAEIASKSPPDGYTLLLVSSGTLMVAASMPKAPIDITRDFSAIAFLGKLPFGLVMHPSLPFKSAREFLGYAKSNAGKIHFATAGDFSVQQVMLKQMSSQSGIRLAEVPYKGTGPALGDVVAGHVQMTVANFQPISGYVREGKLRLLAVTSRLKSWDIFSAPTFSEIGLLRLEMVSWAGLAAPAQTPREIIGRLTNEVTAVSKESSLSKRMDSLGFDLSIGSSEAFQALLSADLQHYRGVFSGTNQSGGVTTCGGSACPCSSGCDSKMCCQVMR